MSVAGPSRRLTQRCTCDLSRRSVCALKSNTSQVSSAKPSLSDPESSINSSAQPSSAEASKMRLRQKGNKAADRTPSWKSTNVATLNPNPQANRSSSVRKPVI